MRPALGGAQWWSGAEVRLSFRLMRPRASALQVPWLHASERASQGGAGRGGTVGERPGLAGGRAEEGGGSGGDEGEEWGNGGGMGKGGGRRGRAGAGV